MEIESDRLNLEEKLWKALERNEFRLYYQPKLNLISGKIVGVEALIRWKHPKKGLVEPAEFIPLIEQSGLIIPIGEWILKTACLQNKTWQKEGYFPILMSVNLSARQLYQDNFIDRVSQILQETGHSPQYLMFEITEGVMLDPNRAPRMIKKLKRLGVQISLDDFGTGFNSLHYLQDLPIDEIKIDQSFVKSATSDLNNSTIVKTVINMAHQMKKEVIAEGIETREQLIFLQQNLCNQGQGYLFSKPLPPKRLMKNFYKIEQIIAREGIPQEVNHQNVIKEIVEGDRREWKDTVRQHKGVIFKLKKENGKFIHTLCDGELLYCMGLTPEQVIGKELSDFLPLAQAEEKTKYYNRTWAGEENVTYEGNINGIFYLASLRPIRNGGRVEGIIGTCIDITKQKQVEEALRMSEVNFHLITENVQDVIVKFDKDWTTLYASPSYKKVFGIPEKEYMGHCITDFVHPEDLPLVHAKTVEMIQKKAPFQIEFRHYCAQGGWVPIESKITPVYGKNDEIECFIAVGRDISEREKIQ